MADKKKTQKTPDIGNTNIFRNIKFSKTKKKKLKRNSSQKKKYSGKRKQYNSITLCQIHIYE